MKVTKKPVFLNLRNNNESNQEACIPELEEQYYFSLF
jgi:hypothetical protein